MESNQSSESSYREPDPPASQGTGDKGPNSFWKRLAGVLLGSRGAFAEIATDRGATWQAIGVILVATLPSVLIGGPAFSPSSSGDVAREAQIFDSLSAMASGLVFTAILAWMVRIVAGWLGTRALAYGGWFRVLGFTSASGVLVMLPIYGWIAAGVYGLVLEVVAIRSLAVTNTKRSIIIVLIAGVGTFLGWVVLTVLYASIGMVFGAFDSTFA